LINKDAIKTIYIKWEKEEQTVFSIMLNRNGTINRLEEPEDQRKPIIIMGKTEESVFQELLDRLDESWFEFTGRYTYPDPKGPLMNLTISFEGEALDTGFSFTYGRDSNGPPADIVQYVELAASLTDSWFEEEIDKRYQSRKRKNHQE